eukprot:TRINITY_DN5734_c0_g1_i1.p3 TRINITY_DN5734_c0_g1~~TRINITY_DN5734_c0_g1_i1.p3  ORF type:complete len:124 (-),score=30.69 TRINITY_DN5734_c0_g1_i1:65-436(-)
MYIRTQKCGSYIPLHRPLTARALLLTTPACTHHRPCRLQYHVEIAHRSNQQWDAIPRFIKEATGGSNSKEAFYARLAHTPEGQLPRTLQSVTINFKHAPQLRAAAAAPLAITAEGECSSCVQP